MASVLKTGYALNQEAQGGAIQWSSGYATSDSLTSNRTTYAAYCHGLGFAIPSSATINGVIVSLLDENTTSDGSYSKAYLRDDTGTLVGVRSISGRWGSALVVGSSTDLWGLSLTPAIINSTEFGAALQGSLGHDHSNYFMNTWQYHMEVEVYYTEVVGPALLKTVNGLAKASVKTIRSSVVIASGKTWNGLA
jgi:hypothetical protein